MLPSRSSPLPLVLALILTACAGSGDSAAPPGDLGPAPDAGPGDIGSEDAGSGDAGSDGALDRDLGPTDACPEPAAAHDLILTGPGPTRLGLDLDPFSLTLYRCDLAVARSASPPMSVGVVETYDPMYNYDPHRDAQGRDVYPDDLTWLQVASATVVEREGASTTLELSLAPAGRARLEVGIPTSDRVDLGFEVSDAGGRHPVFTRVAFLAPPLEAYYGLGESFDQVQRRNTVRAMQFEAMGVESGYNEAHVPVPFLVGTRGWGLFVEDRHPGTFDVAHLDRSAVSATFATDHLDLHLFTGDEPLDVVASYTMLTGPPAVPPLWAFAPQQWRNEHRDQAQVVEDALAMRRHHVPGSCIWIDNPWQTGYNTFEFDPARFPDPEGMIARLHELGYEVVVWTSPYIREDTGELYQRAVEQGLFVDYDPLFTRLGILVDLTCPAAIELWSELISRATSMGVAGFKLDFGEDVVTGAGYGRLVHRFCNGQDERTMHHLYSMYYHRPYAEALRGEGFLLARTGTYGGQAVSTTIWPGDLDSDFSRFGERGAVGGLPAAMIAGLTLSASGYPFFASDTGGFRHGRPSSEVLMRWAAYGALHPVMQLGGGGSSHNPWDFEGEPGEEPYDQTTLDVYRRFASLHMRLVPYAYSLALAAARTGVPVVRPFGLVRPGDGRHPDFTFFYGDSLLVSPSPDGADPVSVPLPEGRWLDWFTHEVHRGKSTVQRPTPFDEVPLYLAEGAIVPMLGPRGDAPWTADTLVPASEPGVDSWATRPGPLHVRLWPGPRPSSFEVFDGATIWAYRDDGVITIEVSPGDRFSGWVLEVEAGERPSKVAATMADTGEAMAPPWSHDPDAGVVMVTLDPGAWVVTME